ncbi:hypothetical protein [Rhizobium anhuiense]|uniref:hypothetical protein n=1 Tax=Rhizobium anhuiense TaxID=1184720 RepID=UPI003CCA3879
MRREGAGEPSTGQIAALLVPVSTTLREGRTAVDAAKIGLGERGPVWWTDGAPDLNRHLAKTTQYVAQARPR